jgi:hypothetical protein
VSKNIVDNEEPARHFAKKVMRENPGLTEAELFRKFEAAVKALPEEEARAIQSAIVEYFWRTTTPSGRN